MKFLADIPIGRLTIKFLRDQGHDVVHVSDRLPSNVNDEAIVDLALREDRVILCFDLGFSALVALSQKRVPSVITFRTSQERASAINAHLERVLPELLAELEHGVLATVEDHRVRIRPLPIC